MLWLWLLLANLGCLGQRSPLAQAAGCSSNATSDCGELCYTGTRGTVTLPTNCSGKYCNSMDCTYQLCPPSDTENLFIAFPVMDLECGLLMFDHIVIQGEKYCDKINTSLIFPIVNDRCLDVKFISDMFRSRSGFTMSYSTELICPAVFKSSAGNVSLPTECGGHYCPNMNCHISICPGSSLAYLTLTFSVFDVDDNETCSGDVLEVDGTAYCSLDSVPRVFSLDRHGCLNLTFRSDSSRQGRGFRFTYQAGVPTSCPAVYLGPKGMVVPPQRCSGTGDPSSSCDSLECAVQLCLGRNARNVTLTASQWDLSCPDDFLETGGRRYCQASPQGEVLPLDGQGCLDLLFHRKSSRGGVQLLYSLYKPECGVGDLVADSGQLSVPTLCQGRYCDNLDCIYRVCPSSASRSLAFSLLMMDVVDSSCTGDYLTIGPSQKRYCSLVSVPHVSVDGSGCVSAGFHSDGHGGGHGFLLSFSAYSEACGVQGYTSDHGTITLPANCDGKYCPDLNCAYTVCPQSHSTHVRITHRLFHTVNTNCASDFLLINQTRICEFDPQPKLYPVDGRGCLSMTFRSDQDSNGFGFRLDYVALSLTLDVTPTPWKPTTTSMVDMSGTPWMKSEVVAVVSSLSVIVLVVTIVLLAVSVRARRAKRRMQSPPRPVYFKPGCGSEPVCYINPVHEQAEDNNSGVYITPVVEQMEENNYDVYITPVDEQTEENNYEVLEDLDLK